MGFLRRVFGSSGQQAPAAPLALFDSSAAPDSRRADTLLAALDIDAAVNAHERWKARLMDYLEGRTTVGLDPAVVRRDDHCALGRWLHGVGGELLGDQPAYALLMARHQYFHEQAVVCLAVHCHGRVSWPGGRQGTGTVSRILRMMSSAVMFSASAS